MPVGQLNFQVRGEHTQNVCFTSRAGMSQNVYPEQTGKALGKVLGYG